MVDLHLHLLPGIDDGPQDLESSVRMARALLIDGIEQVAVSPHVSERFPNTAAGIAQSAATLSECLASSGIELPITTGAEIALDRMAALGDDELIALSIAGRGRHLLLEVPYAAWPMDIEVQVARVESLGMTAVLAHPERCAAVQADPTPLKRLAERGVLAHATAGSIVGTSGRSAQRTAFELIDDGTISFVSSDSHGAGKRPPRMTKAFTALGEGELAGWLTTGIPAALLTAEQLPPRPSGSARGARRGFLRRRG